MKEALVIKSTGKWYQVVDDEGKQWECRIRGRIRLKGLRTTNPIAVGDRVQIEVEEGEEDRAVILDILPRKNYIIRRSVNLSAEAHIVASNVDQAFLMVTLKRPDTSTGFIDRFLVSAEAYEIPVIILFNKIDECNEEEVELVEDMAALYLDIGYEVYIVSALDEVDIKAVGQMMAGKVNMIGGHSGVGKSTLINGLNPNIEIATADVSEYHQKGMHTTTFAEMHDIGNGGYIIDTPGIKGFGLVDIPKEELHHHFPEIFALLPDCKFHNCLHINEPGCAVKAAVDADEIPGTRYYNYVMMYEHDDDNPYRVG